ncbi:aminotransferase class V-fold PLP-dependent enzyme [Xanthomonas sp. XNM01]|uniref:aminotransferase class V-fold PLP-dependent enzyme n=1 Tax=Xanthomonas sp. XNM01 TaxID=2769289 RepID=UPI001CE1D36D|nr:aminotransferase class V-fold PLP-dependent enzyme [Xanthomonas sp. XNM01]
MHPHHPERPMDPNEPRPADPARRRWLRSLGALPVLAALPQLPAIARAVPAPAAATGLARGGLDGMRARFALAGTHINGAFMHPVGHASAAALQRYLDGRLMNRAGQGVNLMEDRAHAMKQFARLVNADIDELAWVPSTMAGENHVVSGLGLPGSRARVVTDAYHFSGSLFMYNELAKQGLDLQVVRPRDNRIQLDDLDRAITPGTRLVALSLVSNVNGFEHDLKAVCDLAHARGALVYADLIQAAGTVPIDLHASGVDFAACSTYKWLMGDFGIGLMYVRRDSLPALRRSQWGYRQEQEFVTHLYPFDPPGEQPLETAPRTDTPGRVEVGTLGYAGVAMLSASLDLLLELGVERIQAWRQPLLQRLQQALPALGYLPMTPAGSRSPIVTFAARGVEKRLAARFADAGVEATLYPDRIRISPSFYNDIDDIERLIALCG